MRLLNLLPMAVIVFALWVMAPAYADDGGYAGAGPVTIGGTVWIDENVDGIHQPSEPVAAGVGVSTWIGGYGVGAYWTDEQGQYSLRVAPFARRGMIPNAPGQSVQFSVHYLIPGDYTPTRWEYRHGVYYLLPGDYTVKEVVWAGAKYTHFGCASVSVKPGDAAHTVDIRLVHHPRGGIIPPLNWPLADGHFFKETIPLYQCDTGYSVTNAGGITFWDMLQRLGLENAGYPTSSRYLWRGHVTQAFQKAIMQWQPGKGVYFIKIFDELHDAGFDHRLRAYFSIPRRLGSLEPALPVHIQGELREKLRGEIHRRRLALLDANPAIKERYYAAPDPLLLYGLPTSRVEDMGNHYAIRTQRTVFQQWKEDVPWAKAGEVTIVNGVDIARAVSEVQKYDKVSGYVYRVYLFYPKERG